jgi:hypothetical protein
MRADMMIGEANRKAPDNEGHCKMMANKESTAYVGAKKYENVKTDERMRPRSHRNADTSGLRGFIIVYNLQLPDSAVLSFADE